MSTIGMIENVVSEARRPVHLEPKISVREAIRRASGRPPRAPRTYSCWSSEISRKRGKRTVREKTPWKHNLTTDTASGYTNRRDWQSKAMGQGPSFAFATAAGTSTAVSATTLTNTGAAFPTAGQGLAGSIVVSANRYGVILSNTATVLTIDQWTDPTSAVGAVGSTPATGTYVILPGQAPAAWMAVSSDATAPAATDTALASELTGSGMARAVGTYSHTAAATTYVLSHLWTATATVTINKEAIFSAANGGAMPFESAEPSPPTLVSGDTLTNTVTITIG